MEDSGHKPKNADSHRSWPLADSHKKLYFASNINKKMVTFSPEVSNKKHTLADKLILASWVLCETSDLQNYKK